MDRLVYKGIITIVLLNIVFFSQYCSAENEKDAFYFEFVFDVHEDNSCHVIVNETITFNEHYVGNPDLMVDFQADRMDAGDSGDSGGGYWGSSGSGPGGGGQQIQAGGGKYQLIKYIHYIVLAEYSPENFIAIDKKTGDRLNVTNRMLDDHIDFIIQIEDYIGAPEKGDTYQFTIEYDTTNRTENVGTGRYSFNFYREGEGNEGLNVFNISIRLPPDYEYDHSMETQPSHVFQSERTTIVRYNGQFELNSKFQFDMQFHFPVTIFIEEGKELMEKGEYSKAQEEFEEAANRYLILEKITEMKEINSLISQCKLLAEANEIFQDAKREYLDEQFRYARDQFEYVLSEYGNIIPPGMQQELLQYIEKCGLHINALQYEEQAENEINKENWDSAVQNLNEAQKIYKKLGEDIKIQSIEENISLLNEKIESEKKKSFKEKLGSQLTIFVISSVVIVGGLFFAFYGFNIYKKKIQIDNKSNGDLIKYKTDTEEEIEKLQLKLDEDYLEDRISREEYLRKKKELEDT